MDESSEGSQQQQQQEEDVNGADDQISNDHCTFSYPPHAQLPVVATSSRGLPQSLPSFTPGASTSKHQLAGMDPKQQRIDLFWADQMLEAEKANDFKNHTLPLARVKKIMKADEDVRMISMEAPVLFAKACEMFISELTMRAWMHTEESKRKTLQKNDIAAAISRNDTFDFLVDILPRDDHDQLKEETHASSTEPIPYYYLPHQHQAGPSGTTVYANYQLSQSMGFMPWPDQLQEKQLHENNEGDENNEEHHENNEGV